MRVALLPLVLFLACLAGCTKSASHLSPAQRQVVATHVSTSPPSPSHRLDLEFGDSARLLGYDVQAGPWRRGAKHRVTWFWQVTGKLPSDAELFTHVTSDEPTAIAEPDGQSTLRWLYPPGLWEPGQYIEDTEELRLPDDWHGTEATIRVGMLSQDGRIPITDGAVDSDDRAHGPTLSVVGPERATHADLVSLGVVRTPSPPRLDGDLTDEAWGAANSTRTFVETRTGGVAPVSASAKALWDDRYLYLAIDVNDGWLVAPHDTHDSHLWEQDCVELMIQPREHDGYFEIQVSPRGVVFDTRYDDRRIPRPFGHVEWNSGLRVAVSARGELDDRESDAGYVVELAIPWQAFSWSPGDKLVPAVGDEWRANFFALDRREDHQQAASWSPPQIGDFHVPARFGILRFEGPADAILGPEEPLQMPLSRVPKSKSREEARDFGVREALIKRRVMNRHHPGEPAAIPTDSASQRLESQQGPH